MTDPIAFRIVLRGYDPAEVDGTIIKLREALHTFQVEAAERTVDASALQAKVGQLNHQVGLYQQRLDELAEQHKHTPPPSFRELGKRIGEMLTLAEVEAAEIRGRAEKAAARLEADTVAFAEGARAAADRYAREVSSRADADAARLMEGARRDSDDILDAADREAMARREEAEAVYEHQQARAAAAAADFEKSLAERRHKAATDFTVQMSENTAALERAAERLAAMETEADRLLTDARTQAATLTQQASDEARYLVDQARSTADRIRRESERELAAAISRRDSIAAQLSNLRQMLATLGGGAAAAVIEKQGAEVPATSAEQSAPADPEVAVLAESVDEAPAADESAAGVHEQQAAEEREAVPVG